MTKKKKYDNESPRFKDWTTGKLKEWAEGLHQSIYDVGCYGCKDLQNYYGVVEELMERGIFVDEETKVSFRKEGVR